ncbi:MAG: PKD domain-containing protein, partial [Candidatus Bathyarchaeia archaeon]
MNLHRNLRRNKKGIGTVFGMVFFILIVVIVFASFMIILNQNTSLENTVITTRQMDNDRATEQATLSILNPAEAPGNKIIYVECDIANDGPLSAQLDRLWIKDITTNQTVNAPISGGLVLNSGSTTPYFNAIGFPNVNSSSTDQFNFWFITARGNAISASPTANQLNMGSNGLVSNSTAGSPAPTIQLSLTTKSPNNLIYLAVIFDDDGQVTPFSTPSLTWVERGESSTTHSQGGDSFLETWYAIMPSSGTMSISFTESNGEGDFYWAAMAFAVSGVNTASPFDGTCKIAIGNNNPHAGSGTQPSLSVSTTNAHDLVVGSLAVDWPTPSITPGSGFTQVRGVKNSGGATQTTETTAPRSIWIESMITNTTNTHLSVNATFTPQDPWAFIADAIKLNTPTFGLPLTLSPTSGPVGQVVTVSGSGLAANSPLLATFAGSPVSLSGSTTTDGSGNIQPGTTFTVPAVATGGSKEVAIIDNKFDYANATFTVTSPIIALSPANGPVGTTVTVTGSNFISSSTIALTFDGNPITTNPSIVTTDAYGSFSATFVASGTGGGNPVLASDGVNSASGIFIVTPSISISPTRGLTGTPITITISGQGYTANSQLQQITFGGALVSTTPANVVSDASGSFSNVIFTAQSSAVSPEIVSVTDASGNSGTATFNFVTLDHFTISGCPSSVNAGTSFGGVTVAAYDSGNNVIDGYLGKVYFTSTDNNAILPYKSTSPYSFTLGDSGSHIFSGFTLETAGSQTITVTGGTISQTSSGITVNPASASAMVVTGFPSPTTANVVRTVTVTAKDPYGNIATGYTGTVHFTSTDVSAALPSDYQFSSTDSGIHTFSVTLKTPGVQSITVTDTATSTITGSQTGITVNSALIAPTVSASPTTIDPGQFSILSSTTVTTGTATYSYQWLQKAPGPNPYSSIAGANSASYLFLTSGYTTAGVWSFELQVTDSGGAQATSSATSVSVDAGLTAAVTPASWSMDVGQSKTFTATASGGSGTYSSYAWYVDSSLQSGQTASTFSYSPASAGSHSITVTVTDSFGATSPQSAAAIVSVNPTVTVSPTSWSMDVGQSETFTATPSGGSGTYTSYQWYVGGVAQSGATASTVSFGPASAGSYLITVTVTDSFGVTSAQSPAASVTVSAAQTVSVTPASWSMDVGQSQTFVCAASGGTGALHYQWYLAGSAVGGQTGATYV